MVLISYVAYLGKKPKEIELKKKVFGNIEMDIKTYKNLKDVSALREIIAATLNEINNASDVNPENLVILNIINLGDKDE